MSSSLKFFVLATSIGYFAFQSSKKKFLDADEEERDLHGEEESAWRSYREFARRYARKRGERSARESKDRLLWQMERHYAAILGLDKRSTPGEIKSRYRMKISLHHPDRVHYLGEAARIRAEEETKAINEAFAFFRRVGRV